MRGGANRRVPPGSEATMPIEREIMRSCLLEAMRRNPRTQFENLKYATGESANERGVPGYGPAGGQARLDPADFRRLREAVWQLINEGVMVVGMDGSNESWPFVSLTEYGEQYARDQRVTPHDRSQYLQRMRDVAVLDDVEDRYVQQALEAYVRNLPDAAAVMIGAAAEYLLILTLTDVSLQDSTVRSDADKALAGPALGMLRFAHSYFTRRQTSLPRELRETLETTFLGIGGLIRVARNDGGHPALPSVDRERCFVTLELYPEYRTWLFGARALLPL